MRIVKWCFGCVKFKLNMVSSHAFVMTHYPWVFMGREQQFDHACNMVKILHDMKSLHWRIKVKGQMKRWCTFMCVCEKVHTALMWSSLHGSTLRTHTTMDWGVHHGRSICKHKRIPWRLAKPCTMGLGICWALSLILFWPSLTRWTLNLNIVHHMPLFTNDELNMSGNYQLWC